MTSAVVENITAIVNKTKDCVKDCDCVKDVKFRQIVFEILLRIYHCLKSTFTSIGIVDPCKKHEKEMKLYLIIAVVEFLVMLFIIGWFVVKNFQTVKNKILDYRQYMPYFKKKNV